MVKRQWTASEGLWVSFSHIRKSVSCELITMIDTMQQMASDINKMRRSLSMYSPIVDQRRLHDIQGTSYRRTPKIGSALQIRRKTTTSDAKSIEMEPLRGSSKEPYSLSGTRKVPFCGYMENVRLQQWPCDVPHSFCIT